MTTATASSATVDKDTKKHQYKDYVHFLGSYKNGKKSDSDYHSSTSSLVSDFSDLNEMPTKSFNEYLHDYNNKKYQPVQPDFIKKTEEPKNIKTEVFIQINNSDISNNDNGQNRDNQIKITIPKPKLDEVDGDPIIKVSVGKLSQKFSSNTNNNNNNTTQKNVLRRTSSITEKTKIFEGKQGDNNASCITKINKENYIEKFPKKVETLTRRNSGHKLNQTFVEIRKQELQNCPRLNGTTSPPYLPSGKIENFKNIEVETAKNNINTKRHSDNNMNKDSSSTNGHTTDPVLCSLPSDALVHARTATLQENIVQVEINGSNCAIPNPPSPPPLPPANLPPRSVTVSPKLSTSSNINPPSFKTTSATLPRAQNGYSTLPKMQNNKNDTVDSSTIDRNDPRMKKMVYGALRGMYGAYHDKANDYLATLPKNRVKKGNGLDSIIDSIAAQGGLEKLCGRSNPKSETETIQTNI